MLEEQTRYPQSLLLYLTAQNIENETKDLHLCRPSFFLSELKEILSHFQTDPPAYLECLSYTGGERKEKSVHGFKEKASQKNSFIKLPMRKY